MKRFLFILILGTILSKVRAQQTDTLSVDSIPPHSPKKATLYSLTVPGLGQAYNKKYWKIPIVYSAIGVPLFFALRERDNYNDFKSAYVARVDDDPDTVDDKYDGIYEDSDLTSLIDYHRKNRDLFFVLTGVAYALNVLDAAVDAHLYYFEVSDDLSAQVKPSFQYSARDQLMIPSLTLSLKFNKKNLRHAF